MNYTVSINQPDIDHLKSDNTVSGISNKSSKIINGTLTTTFTTPADNIASDIEIVRNVSGNVDVYVRANMGSSNYPHLTYTGNLNAYAEPDLTTVVKDVFFFGNTESSGFNINIPGFTDGCYFAAEFTNTTHTLDVYTNQLKNVRQQNQVFDIRGLAYFRDGLYTNPVIEELPKVIHNIHQHATLRYALSADGTVMLSTLRKYLYVYKHRKKIDVYEPSDASGWDFRTSAIRYSYMFETGSAVAISGDAKRCVVAYAILGSIPVLRVIDMNVDLTFGNNKTDLVVPGVYTTNYIHNVCMSMDGNAILISGCKNDFKEGYAHVYSYNGTTWSAGIDLSSSQIPIDDVYVKEYSYGTDSCLSGDGKTIAIFGGPTNPDSFTNSGYVWKFNNLTQEWDFFQTLSFSYSGRIAPCSMSHYGDTLFVIAPNNDKWVVFEYDKRVKRFEKGSEMVDAVVTSGFSMASGSISGDGNTIVYVEIPDALNPNTPVGVYAYTKKPVDGWEISHTINPIIDISFNFYNPTPILTLLISFDGGIALLGCTKVETNSNRVTCINGKKTGTTITSAFDYLNERSNYGFIDYINMTPPQNWSAIPIEKEINLAVPDYGTVDALSMSAYGQIIIIGSPETNKAYLYNNDGSNLIHTFEGPVNRFGICCSIDDYGSIIVIASNTRLYIYDGETYDEIKRIDLSYGGGQNSPWNMKISKDGSTIIASDSVGSDSFKSWTTDDAWSNVNGPFEYNSTAGSKAVSAIDLSVDGSVMIASGLNGATEGYVHLFSKGTPDSIGNVVIPADGTVIIGQSIALSGDGKKAIVGAPNLVNTVSRSARVYFIDISILPGSTTMSVPLASNITGTQNARYGRSVSMDYNGTYAMVSGSMSEYNSSNPNGSALLINTSNITPDMVPIKQFSPKTTLTYNSTLPPHSYRVDFNGYGIHCKLSSQGGVAAVSGGGYASLFKLP
jgi:hypothetical protein